MPSRLPVIKTFKLYIDGAFPRSESGRSLAMTDASGEVVAHLCHASRKDLREAVEAARRAFEKWSNATAYNRGQILYRAAEMLEGKREELVASIEALGDAGGKRVDGFGAGGKGEKAASRGVKSARLAQHATRHSAADEVEASIDRLVYYAGFADKYAQVLGCNNPVSGPYYNFSITEPTGVIAAIAPDEHPLLALISLIAPVIASGNTIVALASQTNPIPAAVFGEVLATSDVPAGVVDLLTGQRAELLKFMAQHRDIDGIHAGNLASAETTVLREGMAENLKRVTVQGVGGSAASSVDWFSPQCQSAAWIEPFVEIKTVWHPASV